MRHHSVVQRFSYGYNQPTGTTCGYGEGITKYIDSGLTFGEPNIATQQHD